MDLRFTHVYEHIRAEMGLTRDEYALCNYIFVWAAYPGSTRLGWCNRTLNQKAAFVGVTPRGLTKMQNRMIQIGLVEKDSMTAHVRTTIAWFEKVNAAKDREQSSHFQGEQSSANQGTKFPKNREQSSVRPGNKVPPHNKSTLFTNDNNHIETVVAEIVHPVETVVDFLNAILKPARPFLKTTKQTAEAVNARMREKYTVEDICLVIEFKYAEWFGDPKMEGFLRPSTLFGTGKFESYLVAASTWAERGKPQINKNGNSNRINGTTPQIDVESVAGAFANR